MNFCIYKILEFFASIGQTITEVFTLPVCGNLGFAFLLGTLIWFYFNPISRDQLLIKFNGKYFVLVSLIMVACTALIAWALSMHWVESINSEKNHFLRAIQFSLKMKEAKDADLSILSFILVMLFQVVVFEGLVLATIVGWTGRRAQKYQDGEVRYWAWPSLRGVFWHKKFAVVIGANEVAPSVIKNLLKRENRRKKSLNYAHEKTNKYVILQTSGDVAQVRQQLQAYLTEKEYNRVIIYSDLRNSYEGLQALHLQKATEIYVLGENTTFNGCESFHDTMNMRCVNMIAQVLTDTRVHKRLLRRLHRLGRRIAKWDEKLQELKKDQENNKKKIERFNHRIKRLNNRINRINNRINRRKKVCKVLFEYQTTYSIFQFSDITKEVSQAMHFIPFNRYESWARRVIVDNSALALIDENDHKGKHATDHENEVHYTPLDDFKGIKHNDPQRVHFIVVGMSKMGVAMGVQALFQAHYPNYVTNNSRKSRITFIDANAKQEMDFFKGRYASLFELARHRYIDANDCKEDQLNSRFFGWTDPTRKKDYRWEHLSKDGKNFLDVEIEFVKGELESDKVREYLRKVTADEKSKVTIAICLPETHQAVAAALYLPAEVYPQVQEIWVYQREAADIITNINPTNNANNKVNNEVNEHYKKLKPFGMLYGEYIDSRTYYLKALLVNGIYALDDKKLKDQLDMGKKKTYKDLRTSWNNLSVSLKWSNKYFVDTIYQKIRSIIPNLTNEAAVGGYNNQDFFKAGWYQMVKDALDNAPKDEKEYLAKCEHNRWNVQQLLLGFTPADMNKDEYIRDKQTETTKLTKPLKDQKDQFIANNKEALKNLLLTIKFKQDNLKEDLSNLNFTELLAFIEKKNKKIRRKKNKIVIDAEMSAQLQAMKECEEKINAINKPLTQYKKALKAPKNKIHYCICDFNHLEAVDPDAKDYDQKLNNGIPDILDHVDGYQYRKKSKRFSSCIHFKFLKFK